MLLALTKDNYMKNATLNEIFNTDADKLMQGERLMPTSLAYAIQKRHYLKSVDDCYDRFEEAILMAKHHKEAFGFIPEEWNVYFISVKLSLKLGDNPTGEDYIDELIRLHAIRFSNLAKILTHKDNEYDEEELRAMSNIELRDVLDELNPVEIKCTTATISGGVSRSTTIVNKKAA